MLYLCFVLVLSASVCSESVSCCCPELSVKSRLRAVLSGGEGAPAARWADPVWGPGERGHPQPAGLTQCGAGTGLSLVLDMQDAAGRVWRDRGGGSDSESDPTVGSLFFLGGGGGDFTPEEFRALEEAELGSSTRGFVHSPEL